MSRRSTFDAAFTERLRDWIREFSEIMVLFRHPYAAGGRDLELFSSFDALITRLEGLRPRTSVVAFGVEPLPIRGVVDDAFIARCTETLPDGADFFVLDMTLRVYGSQSWFHYADGDTHAELIEELTDIRGGRAAVGLSPDWHQDSDEVISAYVPDDDGVIRPGAY